MALTLEAANLVRQKTFAYQLDPMTRKALNGFFAYWAQSKQNADLQLIRYANNTTVSDSLGSGGICQDTGFSPIAGVTSTVYAFYGRNVNAATGGSGTGDGTDSYIRLFNATTNATLASAPITCMIDDDDDTFLYLNRKGLIFGTDLTISADTGTAGTESAISNAAAGFVIVGA